MCVCYWLSVFDICLNYEVVMFQPCTFTTPYLDSVAYCYMDYLLNPPHPIFLPPNVRPGEAALSCPAAPAIYVPSHMIIHLPGCHPYLSRYTEKPPPASSSPVTSRVRLLLPSLAPATYVELLLPPLPCCLQNLV